MKEITITENDAGRRLDRFLRKYLKGASLGEIYKIIRRDLKVDGKRRNESYMLSAGEVLSLYVSDGEFERLTGGGGQGSASGGAEFPASRGAHARRNFSVVYEDSNILVVNKPFGLLTHGDSHEKKNHLANQVKDYLIEKGEFSPRTEKVFSPAPANRIDRNTTGLVLFGKTAPALKTLNELIREDRVGKYYLTIASGVIENEMTLGGRLTKNEERNRVTIGSDEADGRVVTTIVRPLETLSYGNGYTATLIEAELVTGRTHQIRAHLASIGHPIIGDIKYAGKSQSAENTWLAQNLHLTTQILHARRICFRGAVPELGFSDGTEFTAPLPDKFRKIYEKLGGTIL